MSTESKSILPRRYAALQNEIGKSSSPHGHRESTLIALSAAGLLLEGVPGLGKTPLVRTQRSLTMSFTASNSTPTSCRGILGTNLVHWKPRWAARIPISNAGRSSRT